MASTKLSSTIFILSLLVFSTFSNACNSCKCKPKTPPVNSPAVTPPAVTPPAVTPPGVVAKCPLDTLKLGACADLLGGLVNLVVGTPSSSKCCTLLNGLADLEVALCLCTAIKANVLGINLNVPISLSLLVTACEKSIPPGFQCE